jgi:hypothetical protein
MSSNDGFMPERYMQIDVKEVTDKYAVCNLYTGVLCVEVIIKKHDYEDLIRKGFFIRDGKERDSANILNTTESYYLNAPAIAKV